MAATPGHGFDMEINAVFGTKGSASAVKELKTFLGEIARAQSKLMGLQNNPPTKAGSTPHQIKKNRAEQKKWQQDVDETQAKVANLTKTFLSGAPALDPLIKKLSEYTKVINQTARAIKFLEEHEASLTMRQLARARAIETVNQRGSAIPANMRDIAIAEQTRRNMSSIRSEVGVMLGDLTPDQKAAEKSLKQWQKNQLRSNKDLGATASLLNQQTAAFKKHNHELGKFGELWQRIRNQRAWRLISSMRNSILLLAFAFSGLIMTMRKAIETSSAFEKALIGVSTVAMKTGNSVTGAKQAAYDLAQDGLMTVAEAAAGLKNLLATGFSLPEAIQLMKGFKDSAAFGRQAALGFGESIVGATEGLKNNNSILVDNAGLTKNISVILKELNLTQDDFARLSEDAGVRTKFLSGLLKELAIFSGDAKRALDTYQGSVSRLKTEHTLLNKELGDELMPGIKQFNATISEMFRSMREGFAENKTKNVADLTTLFQTLGTTVKILVGALQLVGKVLETIGMGSSTTGLTAIMTFFGARGIAKHMTFGLKSMISQLKTVATMNMATPFVAPLAMLPRIVYQTRAWLFNLRAAIVAGNALKFVFSTINLYVLGITAAITAWVWWTNRQNEELERQKQLEEEIRTKGVEKLSDEIATLEAKKDILATLQEQLDLESQIRSKRGQSAILEKGVTSMAGGKSFGFMGGGFQTLSGNQISLTSPQDIKTAIDEFQLQIRVMKQEEQSIYKFLAETGPKQEFRNEAGMQKRLTKLETAIKDFEEYVSLLNTFVTETNTQAEIAAYKTKNAMEDLKKQTNLVGATYDEKSALELTEFVKKAQMDNPALATDAGKGDLLKLIQAKIELQDKTINEEARGELASSISRVGKSAYQLFLMDVDEMRRDLEQKFPQDTAAQLIANRLQEVINEALYSLKQSLGEAQFEYDKMGKTPSEQAYMDIERRRQKNIEDNIGVPGAEGLANQIANIERQTQAKKDFAEAQQKVNDIMEDTENIYDRLGMKELKAATQYQFQKATLSELQAKYEEVKSTLEGYINKQKTLELVFRNFGESMDPDMLDGLIKQIESLKAKAGALTPELEALLQLIKKLKDNSLDFEAMGTDLFVGFSDQIMNFASNYAQVWHDIATQSREAIDQINENLRNHVITHADAQAQIKNIEHQALLERQQLYAGFAASVIDMINQIIIREIIAYKIKQLLSGSIVGSLLGPLGIIAGLIAAGAALSYASGAIRANNSGGNFSGASGGGSLSEANRRATTGIQGQIQNLYIQPSIIMQADHDIFVGTSSIQEVSEILGQHMVSTIQQAVDNGELVVPGVH